MEKKTNSLIFLSYRRDDTDSETENIFHHLRLAYGEVIFKDNFRIGLGEKWNKELIENLNSSKVILVIIGKNWFSQDQDNCIRLENEDDWVRKEIEFGINNCKKIIPILVNGANMPSQRSFRNLPLLKRHFPFLQAIKVNTRRLNEDLFKLIHDVIPSIGIKLLKKNNQNYRIDILQNYPLRIKPNRNNLPKPYVGLRPFNPNEAFLFFGRDQEILNLILTVESTNSKSNIILYHGQSGVGKSSLLSAGFYPRFNNEDWYIHKPIRRIKEKGIGYQFDDLLKGYNIKKSNLFIIDQVEELFSNPSIEPLKEVNEFKIKLKTFFEHYNNSKLILSFRSDYFTKVRKLLDDNNLSYKEQELFPMERKNMIEAITGVFSSKELNEFYKIKYDPLFLPNTIVKDIIGSENSSHSIVLLQYQLEKLFSLTSPNWKNPYPTVEINLSHYSEEFRKQTINELIDAEFEKVRHSWKEYFENGLILDLLSYYITPRLTANTISDDYIKNKYLHIKDFDMFFSFIKNLNSFLIGIDTRKNKTESTKTRLAHDLLAPIIFEKISDADNPGQRAWRIIEPRLKDIRKDINPALFSSDDLLIIKSGRKGMRHIPGLDKLINKSKQEVEKSLQLEREGAWREMAKQVAHEMKNPLTPMKLSIQYLQHAFKSNPDNIEPLLKRVSSTLIEQIDNIATIASEFSNFAKMPKAENETIKINDLLKSVYELFKDEEEPNININFEDHKEDLYVSGDKNHLIRIFVNLIKNAVQSIPAEKHGIIRIVLNRAKDDNIIVIIEDNGLGISDELKSKIFVPNFTTKESGTGLGLAITKNIVESMNGEIYFTSELNKGSKFYIDIPLIKND